MTTIIHMTHTYQGYIVPFSLIALGKILDNPVRRMARALMSKAHIRYGIS